MMKKLLSILLTVILVTLSAFNVATAGEREETEAYVSGLVGTAANPEFDVEIDCADAYCAGSEFTATVTVKNIAHSDGFIAVQFNLVYSEALTLTNQIKNDGSVDCIANVPNSDWENLSSIPKNKANTVNVATGNASSAVGAIEDGDIVFTFNFKVADDADGDAYIYIPSDRDCYANDYNFGTHYGSGSYAIFATGAHDYGYTYNENGHWQECGICGDTLASENHAFDHSCDTDCNVCDFTRTIEHSYEYAHDEDTHHEHCTVCGHDTDPVAHSWDDGVVTLKPQFGVEGETTYSCTCGAQRTEPIPALVLKPGDLSGDEGISSTDYLMLKRAVLDTFTLSEDQRAAADVNNDGSVNATDYLMLKRVVLGTYQLS